MPNYMDYQKSIAQELASVKNRIRDFIDGNHWGEDGRYKEEILKEVLADKLPSYASIEQAVKLTSSYMTITFHCFLKKATL